MGGYGDDNHVQYNSNVGKEVYIVVTAFVLDENDITKEEDQHQLAVSELDK